MKVHDFTDLKLSNKVHTLGIGGVDVWSLLTKYEGHATILNGVLWSETVKYPVQKWMGRMAPNPDESDRFLSDSKIKKKEYFDFPPKVCQKYRFSPQVPRKPAFWDQFEF